MRRIEHCKRCHRHESDCGGLSARFLCLDCGVGEMIKNAEELQAREGDRYERWKASMRRLAAQL